MFERSEIPHAVRVAAVFGLLVAAVVCWAACDQAPTALTISYPFDGSLFPRDIAAPTVRWEDSRSDATAWSLQLRFGDSGDDIEVTTAEPRWTPSAARWALIKARTLETKAVLTVVGFDKVLGVRITRSRASVSFSTSKDAVGAPIFFRLVPLPFAYALKHMDEIKWVLGDLTQREPPRVVLEKLPVCGNCHSFSTDGKRLGMDIDYANDKGSYVITDVAEEMVLGKEAVITWSDYARADGEVTLGLLSQISPSGRYVVGTVKDKSVFLTRPDLAYSQLFFPMRGILAYYDTEAKVFGAVPGAADRDYVQSNPAWSPDEKHLVFAKHRAEVLGEGRFANSAFAKRERANEFVDRRKLFRFDLHKVPFNGGRGGDAVPIPGASNNERSNYFAKYSPDGRWIVFCQADSFMLLQADSELYIMEAKGGRPRRMNCNTKSMNSWHSWSPNGKWLVFASKLLSPYTQLYLTHIDDDGNDTPPVLVYDPTELRMAANIPEFANIPVGGIRKIHERYVEDYSYLRKGSFLEFFFGDTDLATRAYKKALELNPDNVDAHNWLGHIHMQKDEAGPAKIHFQEQLRVATQRVQGKARSALSDADLALLIRAHGFLGMLHASLREPGPAIEQFKAILELDSSDFMAYLSLATAYGETDRPELALEALESALKLRPGDEQVRQKVEQLRAAPRGRQPISPPPMPARPPRLAE